MEGRPFPGIDCGISGGGEHADGSESDGREPKDMQGYVGAYSPESRRERVERFIEKRNKRVWTKKVKYDVRKNFADSRLRVKVCKLILWLNSKLHTFL